MTRTRALLVLGLLYMLESALSMLLNMYVPAYIELHLNVPNSDAYDIYYGYYYMSYFMPLALGVLLSMRLSFSRLIIGSAVMMGIGVLGILTAETYTVHPGLALLELGQMGFQLGLFGTVIRMYRSSDNLVDVGLLAMYAWLIVGSTLVTTFNIAPIDGVATDFIFLGCAALFVGLAGIFQLVQKNLPVATGMQPTPDVVELGLGHVLDLPEQEHEEVPDELPSVELRYRALSMVLMLTVCGLIWHISESSNSTLTLLADEAPTALFPYFGQLLSPAVTVIGVPLLGIFLYRRFKAGKRMHYHFRFGIAALLTVIAAVVAAIDPNIAWELPIALILLIIVLNTIAQLLVLYFYIGYAARLVPTKYLGLAIGVALVASGWPNMLTELVPTSTTNLLTTALFVTGCISIGLALGPFRKAGF